MKVLITGGAGFIGSHLTQRLHRGHELTVLDDLSAGPAHPMAPGVRFIEGSILDEDMVTAMSGVDAVVHLAAVTSVPVSLARPGHTHAVNATGTLLVLEAARRCGVKHIVLASSAAVYGDGQSNEEDAPTRPLSPYGASKVAAEAYAAAYAATWRMNITTLRLFNIYGPGQAADHPYAPVVARFVKQALADQPIPIFGDGWQTREFTHVYTVCDLIERVLQGQMRWPTPVNLAYGEPITLLELVRRLGEVLGRELTVETLPPRRADIYRSGASGRLMRDLLRGWDDGGPSPVSLHRGLSSMVPRELVRI